MPALPWREFQAVDPGRQYAAMASRLPLRAHRSVPGFLLDAMRIRGQLAHAPGLVGYALDAQPARKTFWTISVWEDEQSLSRFAAADLSSIQICSVGSAPLAPSWSVPLATSVPPV